LKTADRTRPAAPGNRLGERLRSLRLTAGLTQTELAGDRFSKEYVSQIERGKTRPTAETIEWLAARLGVDPSFLQYGVSDDERGRIESALARGEALLEAKRHDDALAEFARVAGAVRGLGATDLEVRALKGEAAARIELGQLKHAAELLARARGLVEAPQFSDLERAEILYRLGVCRYHMASTSTAVALLKEALALAERSGLPADRLKAEILHWRSRCYRRQRDFEAAREDVELALELARSDGDRLTEGRLYFQASLVAERMGSWQLSRQYAERARFIFEELNEQTSVGRVLNNLGGINFVLGDLDGAMTQLKEAFRVFVETGAKEDAGHALGGIASVHLQKGEYEEAERAAREALGLLDGRDEFLDEIGGCHLTLGRSLLERDRLEEAEAAFRAADDAFARLSSLSHRAGAWIALGDLAARRGDTDEASRLYRQAAASLHDIRF
jgi:tetratricopeptide (TPR) repeat protein